jgi:hypothetical protein
MTSDAVPSLVQATRQVRLMSVRYHNRLSGPYTLDTASKT